MDIPAAATILIADDNPQILELLEAYLDLPGVRIITAANGEQSLESVERERPDLILLDVMMPKRSGFEVCRQLKQAERTRQIPILMITALNEPSDVDRARELGADDIISKPVNKLDLLARVRRLLEHRAAGPSDLS
ncbi:MAG: response regulator [Phycisphaerales bacterium]|nr:response regulator [Phycisphaerales bacterium]